MEVEDKKNNKKLKWRENNSCTKSNPIRYTIRCNKILYLNHQRTKNCFKGILTKTKRRLFDKTTLSI